MSPRKQYKSRFGNPKPVDSEPLDFDDSDASDATEPEADDNLGEDGVSDEADLPDEPDVVEEPRPRRTSSRGGSENRESSRGSKRSARTNGRSPESSRRSADRDARDSRRSPRGGRGNSASGNIDAGGRGRRGGRKEKDHTQLLVGGGIALAIIIIVIIAATRSTPPPVVNDPVVAENQQKSTSVLEDINAVKAAAAKLEDEISAIERREAKSDAEIRQKHLDKLKQAQLLKSKYDELTVLIQSKRKDLNVDDMGLSSKLDAERDNADRLIRQTASLIESIERDINRPSGEEAARKEKEAKEAEDKKKAQEDERRRLTTSTGNVELSKVAQDNTEGGSLSNLFVEPEIPTSSAAPRAEARRLDSKLSKDGKWDKHFESLPAENPPAVFIHGVGNVGKVVYALISFTNTWTESVRVMNIDGKMKQIGGSELKDQSKPHAWFYTSEFKPSTDDIFDTLGVALTDKIEMVHPGQTVKFIFAKQCEIDAEAVKAGRVYVDIILFPKPGAPKFFNEGPMQ